MKTTMRKTKKLDDGTGKMYKGYWPHATISNFAGRDEYDYAYRYMSDRYAEVFADEDEEEIEITMPQACDWNKFVAGVKPTMKAMRAELKMQS